MWAILRWDNVNPAFRRERGSVIGIVHVEKQTHLEFCPVHDLGYESVLSSRVNGLSSFLDHLVVDDRERLRVAPSLSFLGPVRLVRRHGEALLKLGRLEEQAVNQTPPCHAVGRISRKVLGQMPSARIWGKREQR